MNRTPEPQPASEGSLPILYSFRRCPYAIRARLAVAASRTPCELREVVLRDKPQALLDVSPKATVPVLVDIDGKIIDESLDIMLWALNQNDPGAWLQPSQGSLADILALIRECDGSFKHHLDRYKYPQRYQNVEATEHRDEAGAWLHALNDKLAVAPYLFGHHATLADMAIMPFVRQYAHTDMAWFEIQPWPALRSRLDAWKASEQFAQVMEKYPAWTPQTGGVRFPPV
jgi:glutathione S-transferase